MSKFKIGYKKPPMHTRFKPGNKEHLKRTKRDAPKEGEIFRKAMATPVSFREGKTTKYERRMDLIIKKNVGLALKGDVRAAHMLLKMHAEFRRTGDINPQIIWLSEREMKV